MKKAYFIFLIIIFLSACTGSNDKSDAYGTFEAKEIIISAQSTGKIIHFEVNEGDILKSGTVVGQIDTVDLSLKKQQAIAQRNAVAANVSNILSQIEVKKQQKSNLIIEKERVQKLIDDDAATGKQLDDIIGAINLVEKQIESIKTQNKGVFDQVEAYEIQIAQIKEAINRAVITNPVQGTVLTKCRNQ